MALKANPERIYQSTKTYCHNVGLSCCFRQWRATSHCRYMHGYALEVRITFEAHVLDENGWVFDFGKCKEIKQWLEDTFDHKTLIAKDDPHIDTFQVLNYKAIIDMVEVDNVGVEAFADMIMTQVQHLTDVREGKRVSVVQVEVSEHAGNSAIVRGT